MHVCKWCYLHICRGRIFNCISLSINKLKESKSAKINLNVQAHTSKVQQNFCVVEWLNNNEAKKPTLLVLWPLHTSMRKYHKLNLFYVFFSLFFLYTTIPETLLLPLSDDWRCYYYFAYMHNLLIVKHTRLKSNKHHSFKWVFVLSKMLS